MLLSNVKCILIGGSAGCGALIQKIFASIPVNFKIPIVIVRHIRHDDIDNSYSKLLSEKYSLKVVEPEDKEPINNSTIYIAPPGYHLMIEPSKIFSLNIDERVHYSRPSIDVLFESGAKAYKSEVLGILLSGSNSDGAFGIKEINKHNGLTVVQDPKTAEFPFMPESALMDGTVNYILHIDEIVNLIIEINKNLHKRGEL